MKRLLIILILLASCALTPQPQVITIQQMIDNAAEAGQTLAVIPPGVYEVSQTIEAAPGVAMDMQGVTLRASANVDIIRMAKRAHLEGAYIDVSNVQPYTQDVLDFDGAELFDTAFPTFIHDVQMLGNWQASRSGTAIHLHAESGYVMGVVLSNIGMSYFENGILIEATAPAFANANQFANITIQRASNAIWLLNADGNLFSNIQIQPEQSSVYAAYISGSHNMFGNFFVWDWFNQANQYAIVMAANSKRNFIQTNLSNIYYLDNGNNRVIAP